MKPQDFDPVFEAMLRQAVRDNIYEEAESVPGNDVLATMFTISKRHDARMRRLCAREDRREQLRVVMKPVRRVAVAAMIAITVLFGSLMLNTTVRAAVVEVIIEWYEQFTRFVGIGGEEAPETQGWAPSYLPDGYFEVSVFASDSTIIEYENENADILVFRYSPEINDLRVDNEESEYYTEEFDSVTYYIFIAEDSRKTNRITWFRSGYRFNLAGYLDLEQLLEVAESVVEKNN